MPRNQFETPIFTALKNYYDKGMFPFHVPGHKQGKGLAEFADYVGGNALGIDLTCTPALDNICNPNGIIKDAEELTADLYGRITLTFW